MLDFLGDIFSHLFDRILVVSRQERRERPRGSDMQERGPDPKLNPAAFQPVHLLPSENVLSLNKEST